ncbi:hypothetical protein [Streptomyces sp. NPDC058745]|uniref:hypothetical protein n=1 Tax=Streptomyces sp. NPDC058745 TaxID=3346621 RepID=UPI0036A7A137
MAIPAALQQAAIDRYVTALTEAAADAPAVWDRYQSARRAMEAAFVALGTTDSNRWIAAVSKLIATHDETLLAAASWDAHAEQIAAVHAKHLDARIATGQAYDAAGIHATDWLIAPFDAYDFAHETPLLTKAKQAVREQRDHVRKVAFLTDPHGWRAQT